MNHCWVAIEACFCHNTINTYWYTWQDGASNRHLGPCPQANAINDKSHPNSTTNIHDSSGYAGGAAQIPQVNAINDNDKSFTIQSLTSTFLQVTPEVLPKFHRQTSLMTSLPQTSTIVRLRRRRCPKSTSSSYCGGAARIPQVNAINDNDKSFTINDVTQI